MHVYMPICEAHAVMRVMHDENGDAPAGPLRPAVI